MTFRAHPTHLRNGDDQRSGMHAPTAACGVWNPRRSTTELQAVTCQRCIDAADLAPA